MEKESKKKLVLWGIGLTAAGVAGYFGWQYYKQHKAGKSDYNAPEDKPSAPQKVDTPVQPKKQPAPVKPKVKSDFPLKRGSKGEKVKAVQEGLIARYGKTIMPKYGTDGDFGSELENALKSKGYPVTIDETLYKTLTTVATESNADIAAALVSAAKAKDYNQSVTQLKKIKTAAQYSAVSNIFKQYDTIGTTRYSLVTAMSRIFPSSPQKLLIRDEFLRMGLEYDAAKDMYSLPKNMAVSGIDLPVIITTKATKVWKDKTSGYNVPANMVLGTEVKKQGANTVFENNGRLLVVSTQAVKYY